MVLTFQCHSGRHRSVAVAELIQQCILTYMASQVQEVRVLHMFLHHPENERPGGLSKVASLRLLQFCLPELSHTLCDTR